MKIGVLGEPCVDYIHFPDGKFFRSYGGILYSLLSMSVLADKDDIIYPIFNLGTDEFGQMTEFLSVYKNLDLKYIKQVEHSTRVVKLFYNDEALNEDATYKANNPKTYDREESSTEPTLPVEFKDISKIIEELDALLINMVSGVDITVDTLKQIRRNFKGYIHMDIHNIVMRTDGHGNRTRGYISDWLEWCTNSNTLQMNESELKAIGYSLHGEDDTIKEIFNSDNKGKPDAVLVTRGKFGVTIYHKKNAEIKKYEEAPIVRIGSTDPTGCGDTFASAFLLKNIKNAGDHLASLKYANNIASKKTTLRGIDELYNLKD